MSACCVSGSPFLLFVCKDITLKFSDLGLERPLLQAIEKLGFESCTPIQSLTIPVVLEGRDISGLSQTGTGKTAAFLIPLMDRILKGRMPSSETATAPESSAEAAEEGEAKAESGELPSSNREGRCFKDWRAQNFVLVLVPTRELAEQVFENIKTLSEFSGLRGVSVYGGTGYDKQKEGLKAGVEFVVATPGRLIDLYKEHICDLKQVRAVVFDEADRMFDMGFKDDMKYILQRIPKDRQIAVFSATMNFDVLNTLYQFGADPVEIDVSRDQTKAENVKDEIFHVGQEDKGRYLLSLFKKHNPKQSIVFSNFKTNVERIANFLTQNGIPAVGISSLLTQAQRNRVLEQFKGENEMNVLVATDVAARGLDIKGVDMVVNYELPNDSESYVHRIGRTGRAGAEGKAFSMVSDRDVDSLQRIEDYLKHKLPVGWMEDSEIITEYKPFPSESSYDRGDRKDRGERSSGPRRDGGRRDGRRDGGGRGDGRRDNRRDGGGSRDGRDQRDQRDSRDNRQSAQGRDRGAAGGNRGRNNRGQQQGQPGSQQRHNGNRDFQNRDGRRNQQGNRDRNFKAQNGNRSAQNRRPLPKDKKPTVSVGVLGQVKSWLRRLWD